MNNETPRVSTRHNKLLVAQLVFALSLLERVAQISQTANDFTVELLTFSSCSIAVSRANFSVGSGLEREAPFLIPFCSGMDVLPALCRGGADGFGGAEALSGPDR